MRERTVSCSCGALTATVRGDPARNSICHCLNCKRRTGAAFSWNATFKEDQIDVAGEHASFTRSSDDGYWVRHHFCPECGIRVFYAIERRPGMISVPAGLFAEPDFPPPTIEVYEERRCAWLPELVGDGDANSG